MNTSIVHERFDLGLRLVGKLDNATGYDADSAAAVIELLQAEYINQGVSNICYDCGVISCELLGFPLYVQAVTVVGNRSNQYAI